VLLARMQQSSANPRHRQRILSITSTPFSLVHKHLPGELLQHMRIPPPKAIPQRRRPRRGVIDEDEAADEQ